MLAVVLFVHYDGNTIEDIRTIKVEMEPQNSNGFTVLSANVGNLSLGCRKYLNNLCYKEVEQRIADNIQTLKPGIVTLQEVLAPWQCQTVNETNKKRVCYEKQEVAQVRRLLGPDYTVVCDTRNQFECVGVRMDLGIIDDCKTGELCFSARTAPALPDCDPGFTVSAVTVRFFDGLIFDLVNLHPQSTNDKCRAQMLAQIFASGEDFSPLLREEKVLLMGDFNMDPWRDEDKSVQTWQEIFRAGWGGYPLRYHNAGIETGNPDFTAFILWRKRTYDFIVSNFAVGTCVVLGESSDTPRLDGGHGMDHRALYGMLKTED